MAWRQLSAGPSSGSLMITGGQEACNSSKMASKYYPDPFRIPAAIEWVLMTLWEFLRLRKSAKGLQQGMVANGWSLLEQKLGMWLATVDRENMEDNECHLSPPQSNNFRNYFL